MEKYAKHQIRHKMLHKTVRLDWYIRIRTENNYEMLLYVRATLCGRREMFNRGTPTIEENVVKRSGADNDPAAHFNDSKYRVFLSKLCINTICFDN